METQTFRPWERLLLPLVDLALLAGGLVLAMWLRADHDQNWQAFLTSLPWTLLLGWVTFFAFGLYMDHLRSRVDMVRQVVLANLVITAGLGLLAFWLRAFAIPRSAILLAFVFTAVFLSGWRVLLISLKLWLRGGQRILVVAEEAEADSLSGKVESMPSGWYHRAGVTTPAMLLAQGARALTGADVILVGAATAMETRRRLVMLAQEAGVAVYIVPGPFDIMTMAYDTDQLDDIPVLRVQPIGLSPMARVLKRAFDLPGAIVMGIFTFPFMAVAALAVRISSGGPVFYAQERVGESGRPFICWKFRTMFEDAERDGPQLARANDPRVTPLGRFLRRTRVDELPQLWNVLKGEMSLVGPRPERPVFVRQFEAELPEYRLRHLVKPGLTGLAQVLAGYSTTAPDKLRYDLYYIRQYSLWLDVKILLLTVWRVFAPRESAEPAPAPLRAQSGVK